MSTPRERVMALAGSGVGSNAFINQEKRKRRYIPRGKLYHGKGCTNNPPSWTASHQGLLQHCHCPSPYRSEKPGRLSPYTGQARRAEPDCACKLGWGRMKAGVSWASIGRWQGKGNQAGCYLQEQFRQTSSPDKAKHFEPHLCARHWGDGAVSVFAAEGQICLRT